MRRLWLATAGVILTSAACGGAATESGTPAPTPDPTAVVVPENDEFLPVGAQFEVELNETLTTDTDRGTLFTATIKDSLTARNGAVVLPAGTVLTGMVTGTRDPDGLDEPGIIRLNFIRMKVHGVTHPFSADVVEVDLDLEDGNWREVADQAGTGAAAAAVLGAILGGELREAVVGSGVGAGAGTIISLGFGDDGALPRGTDLMLRATVPVDLAR